LTGQNTGMSGTEIVVGIVLTIEVSIHGVSISTVSLMADGQTGQDPAMDFLQ
jgi:hypothetical protein